MHRAIGIIVLSALVGTLHGTSAMASHTPVPSSVTVSGNLQSELGCPGDWDPGCAATRLTYEASDEIWRRTFAIPAGSWEYKAALSDSWVENYGANAVQNGSSVALSLTMATSVRLYYDHESHWFADSRNESIAVAAGSFQSELGCPSDWQPDCLRSWLQDPDGDGTYTLTTTAIPAGGYEVKVAIDERWDENYGAGGVRNGPNVPFSVSAAGEVRFSYDAATHVLTVSSAPPELPAAPPGPPAAPPPGPEVGDTEAPDTTIVDGPETKTKRKRATFEFVSSESGATFECSLDGGEFASCGSPTSVKVKKGKHSLEVRATDQTGSTDATPATFVWKVKK